MCRGDLDTHSSFAFWHHRICETACIQPLFKKLISKRHGLWLIHNHNRGDWVTTPVLADSDTPFSKGDSSSQGITQFLEFCSEINGVFREFLFERQELCIEMLDHIKRRIRDSRHE